MTKIISTSTYNNKKSAIIRSGIESFEIIIDVVSGITEVWQAQFKKLNRGYEEEVFPKLILKANTVELASKYTNPKEMIENYMLLGRI